MQKIGDHVDVWLEVSLIIVCDFLKVVFAPKKKETYCVRVLYRIKDCFFIVFDRMTAIISRTPSSMYTTSGCGGASDFF